MNIQKIPGSKGALLRLFLLLQFLLTLSCTVSPKPKESAKSLVSQEAPIFDKRFRDLTFKDLDLSNLWIEGRDPKTRKNK